MKPLLPLLLLGAACASPAPANMTAQDAPVPRGPWSEVPAVEMPTGDTSIPISLLRDVADALLKLPGAKVCDWADATAHRGHVHGVLLDGLCGGDGDSLSWRVPSPSRETTRHVTPFFAVKDDDYPPSQVWVVGYVHNHLCAAPPSSRDLGHGLRTVQPLVAMAEVRLWPGNPAPARYKNTAIEMASALVAERQDGTRSLPALVSHGRGPTVEQCQGPLGHSRYYVLPAVPTLAGMTAPQCRDDSLQLLRE